MKVYIAASSKELDRAQRWHDFAKQRNQLVIVSTWLDDIKAAGGVANLIDSDDERIRLSLNDLEQVDRCDLFWLLFPLQPTIGAWIELGHSLSATRRALKRPRPIIVSGGAKQTIFTSLTTEIPTDAAAFEYIVTMAADR